MAVEPQKGSSASAKPMTTDPVVSTFTLPATRQVGPETSIPPGLGTAWWQLTQVRSGQIASRLHIVDGGYL